MSGFTTTPNYGFRKPIVGADNDAWGGDWNLNADSLDSIIKNTNNLLANYLPLAGGTLSGPLTLPLETFTDGSSIGAGNPMMPDLAWWRRDTAGNIVQATDYTGATLLQSLQVFGASIFAGAFSATGPSAAFTLAPTVPGIAFTIGDLIQRPALDPPDLARYWRDTAGNIALAIDVQGSVITQNMQVLGTLTAPGFTGGGASASSPADTLDITAKAYGGVGDGNDDVFLGTWVAAGNTLTIIKFAGPITWSGAAFTLSGLDTIGEGPGFDMNCVGSYLYVSATDGSGINQLVQITGWTSVTAVTVSASPAGTITTANVTWPCFSPTDVGKAIRVGGAGLALTRQSYNGGVCAYLGTIATVVSGNQVTVTGTVSPNFATAGNGIPTRVSWGTDNTPAYVAMVADVTAQGVKYIWHPRNTTKAKTVYCAFKLAQRGAFDTYYWLYLDAERVYSGTVWLGDSSVTGVLTDITGRLMPKRIIPSRSRPINPPGKEVIARLHLSRSFAVVAPTPVKVVHSGDSLSKYDPTGQSDAWFPMTISEEVMVQQNSPRKTFQFTGVAVSGAGWSEMVDPTQGYPWVIAGTDLYHLSSSGRNDFFRGHPLKIMSGINHALASGNDAAGRPPDILLTSAAQNTVKLNIATAASTEGFNHTEDLVRSMARCQNYGFVNYHELSETLMHGVSSVHREMQSLPNVLNWSLSPTTPFAYGIACNSWAMQVALSVVSGSLWTPMSQLVVALSPMPGNVLIFDSDGVHVRYEVRLWGRSVPTTVTTSGSTITTAAGITTAGTINWTASQLSFTHSGGGFTGKQGQCVFIPGGDISGQHQRTYINQVINDTTIVVDDFWWGADAGGNYNQVWNGVVTLTVGGQVFLAVDADAQSDVYMTWGTNSSYRGKITGFTSTNAAILTPAPPPLTNQAVQLWIGRTSAPQTVTSLGVSGTSLTLRFSLDKDYLSVRNSLEAVVFRGPIEHYGNAYYPTIAMVGSGSVTASFSNLYADRDVFFSPEGTISDLWGPGGTGWPYGGESLHYSSIMAARLGRRVYEAQDFCLL